MYLLDVAFKPFWYHIYFQEPAIEHLEIFVF
jgi:hypothetical protein